MWKTIEALRTGFVAHSSLGSAVVEAVPSLGSVTMEKKPLKLSVGRKAAAATVMSVRKRRKLRQPNGRASETLTLVALSQLAGLTHSLHTTTIHTTAYYTWVVFRLGPPNEGMTDRPSLPPSFSPSEASESRYDRAFRRSDSLKTCKEAFLILT